MKKTKRLILAVIAIFGCGGAFVYNDVKIVFDVPSEEALTDSEKSSLQKFFQDLFKEIAENESMNLERFFDKEYGFSANYHGVFGHGFNRGIEKRIDDMYSSPIFTNSAKVKKYNKDIITIKEFLLNRHGDKLFVNTKAKVDEHTQLFYFSVPTDIYRNTASSGEKLYRKFSGAVVCNNGRLALIQFGM